MSAILAGAVAGLGVLGVGGRLAMAALPFITGAPTRFSWGGSLEVVLLGTIYGAIGGIALALLRRTRVMAVPGASTGFGLLMFGVAWLTSPVGRATAPTAPVAIPIVLAFSAGVFVAYGMLASSLARQWSGSAKATAA
ncbi:MAG: hypothetical protein KF689_02815 [Gemmatimonadaceae bacterium]|nr:hypothetical protein [Gemmatimonadaceae bacterium]MCW5827663.1 hypothetical protein [Gemmatimonadaceae bacterium]